MNATLLAARKPCVESPPSRANDEDGLMANSATLCFTDPYQYQMAIRNAEIDLFPTAKGEFRAELTQISLNRLSMQRAHEGLPRVYRGQLVANRAPVSFLTEEQQPPHKHCGIEVSFGQLIVNDTKSLHRQTPAASSWGALSLTHDDLAFVSKSITGTEIAPPPVTQVIRPSPALMSRLLKLHETAGHLAETTPDILKIPRVAEALEHELVHVMVRCLAETQPAKRSARGLRRLAIIRRFEEFLEANLLRPLYLAEICVGAEASERMLRLSCYEHLGMGPVRYLWLRRMYLARRALVLATPGEVTVTQIATEHGFWELGRFSIEYRALFGELPSASLRGRPDERLGSLVPRTFG